MEVETGEEETQHEVRESDEKKEIYVEINFKVPPDHPGHITEGGEGYVYVGEFLAETDTRILITTSIVQSGEGKEGNRGEDYEGGLSVEDLKRGFIKEVQSGEEREEELGKK